METVPDPSINWLANTTSNLRVSSYAFNKYSLEEFHNILVHHEGIHAWQNYFEYAIPQGNHLFLDLKYNKNINFFEKDVVQEIEAYNNQMNHQTFFECGEQFKEEVVSWLEFYEKIHDKF